MNEGTQAQAAETSTAVAPAAADVSTSQPAPKVVNIDDLSLEQIEGVLYGGQSIEGLVVGGEGKTTDQVEPAAAAAAEPAPGEQPAPVEPAAAAAEEVVETRTPEAFLADQVAAAEAVKAAGGDEAAQQAAADEAAKPGYTKPAEAPAAEPDPEGIARARFSNERDQLIVGIYKRAEQAGKPISWAEAEARVDGPKEEPAAPVPVEPPVDHVAVVSGLEGEIAAIEAKLADHEEGLYTKELAELTASLATKQTELVFAKRDLQQAARDAEAAQATAAAESTANRTASHAEAIELYPDVADDQTPLGQAVAKDIAAMKNPRHPDHAILFADSAPLAIAQRNAVKLGIQPVKKAGAPPAKPPVPAAPPVAKVTPAPGSKTSVVPAKPAEDVKARVAHLRSDKATLAELDAAFGAGDPANLLAGAAR